jgi:hypothetical protein
MHRICAILYVYVQLDTCDKQISVGNSNTYVHFLWDYVISRFHSIKVL